jgi:ribose 5-phosphate isomerase A
MSDPRTLAKRAAARAAAEQVPSGSRVGLGTGSTVAHALDRLAERIRDEGLEIVGVPTSAATARRAAELGIALTSLDEVDRLDLTIDGADEVDPQLELIKGGGGALTREKIVAAASSRFLVIVDAAKLVPWLGATFRLPIEVLEFGLAATRRRIAELGIATELRHSADGTRLVTDNGHLVLDGRLTEGRDLRALEAALDAVPGVVECGLFLGMADLVFVGEDDGSVRTIRRG